MSIFLFIRLLASHGEHWEVLRREPTRTTERWQDKGARGALRSVACLPMSYRLFTRCAPLRRTSRSDADPRICSVLARCAGLLP